MWYVKQKRAEWRVVDRAHRHSQWKDLPERYGKKSTVHERFKSWKDNEVLEAILPSFPRIAICKFVVRQQMLEMDEHLGCDKNSVLGNNSGNSRNGYNRKTIISGYGTSEVAIPRDRNGEFEPKVLEKR